MRTIEELLKDNIQREEMTEDEHVTFVDYWFDKYEKEGFSKVFCSPYDGEEHNNGKPFEVVGRVKAYLGNGDIKEDEADLETLPMWKIKFLDGKTMAAYAEEIIPSEITGNVWREKDKQLIGKL